MNLTPVFSRVLDVSRTLFFGTAARLVLMSHATSGGYSKGVEITQGWLVSDESEGDGDSAGQLKLEVAESATVTATTLRACAGFALLRTGENAAEAIFCKVVSRKEPVEELSKVWIFQITPNKKELVSI